MNLDHLKIPHHNNEEDRWYSCPLSEDGCSNDGLEHRCYCGADEHNAAVDEVQCELGQFKTRFADLVDVVDFEINDRAEKAYNDFFEFYPQLKP